MVSKYSGRRVLVVNACIKRVKQSIFARWQNLGG
jgi:hypothetical protein